MNKNRNFYAIFFCIFSFIFFFVSELYSEDISSEILIIDLDVDSSGLIYEIGDKFRIYINNKTGFEDVLDYIEGVKNLKVRVFRGSLKELKNHKLRGRKTNDNCRVYYSKCFRPHQYNGGLDIDYWFNIQDLKIRNDKTLANENYIFVFEKSNFNSDLIKLNPKDINSYFDHGIQFKVLASSKIKKRIILEAKKAQLEARDKLSETLSQNEFSENNSKTCKAYIDIANQQDSKNFATLVPVECNN